ncbi:MAG: hypothetical protein WC663_01490 [Patescibacteria group bacterium]|jgi:hypothetical protein
MDNEYGQSIEETVLEKEKPTEKEWEDYKTEIENFRGQIYQKAEEVLGNDDGGDWVFRKVQDFTYDVSANIPNYRFFIAFHGLIGSGVSIEKVPFLDLPSPYNVKDFCNKLLLELDDKESCQKYLRERKEK